jgi:hypothetical protein
MLNIIGWTLLIASCTSPEKLFKNKMQMYRTRMGCSTAALVIFTIQLINLLSNLH